MYITGTPKRRELYHAAAYMAVMQSENYTQTQTEIIEMLVEFTQKEEERQANANPGVDMAEVGADCQDAVLASLDAGTFPMDNPMAAIKQAWKRTLFRGQSARDSWGRGVEVSTLKRARRAVNAVREAGVEVTVEAAYAAGQKLFAATKNAPSRDAVEIVVTRCVSVDTPTARQLTDNHHPGDDRNDGDPVEEALEQAMVRYAFMPTPQTHRDLATLTAARYATRKGSDGGIDCRRLDIVALLRFGRKKYDNGREVFEVPERTQMKLLGVDAAGLAALVAELEAAITAAREDARSLVAA